MQTRVCIMTLNNFDNDLRKANPKAAMVRVEVRDAQGYASQRRHDLRIGPQPAYVNPDAPEPNRVLIQPLQTAELKALAKTRRDRRPKTRAMKRNAGIAVIGLIGFGIEAQSMFEALSPEQQNQALCAAVMRVAAELNTTVTGLVLHVDETARHAHFSLCGYDETGTPLSSCMGRKMLRRLQTALHEELRMFMPDLERGRARKARAEAGAQPHEIVHRSVRELHADLPLEIAQARENLRDLEEKVRVNETRAQKARAKAEADAARAEKALKNAEIYERRAREAHARAEDLAAKIMAQEARLAEISAAQAAAERERDAAQQKAEIAEARAEAAERRVHEVERVVKDTAMLAAETAAAVIAGDLRQDENGRWKAGPGAPSAARLTPVWRYLRPAMEGVARWWAQVHKKIETLPKPQRTAFIEEIRPRESDEGPEI